MKYLILALILVGCSAQVEPLPCPVVECAWTTIGLSNVCSEAYSAKTHFEQPDELTACWIHDAVCVPQGTREECIPTECHRTIADCQPDGEARVGRP